VPLRVLIYRLLPGDPAPMVQIGHFRLEGGHPERQGGATGAFTFSFFSWGVIKTPHGGTKGVLFIILRLGCAKKPG